MDRRKQILGKIKCTVIVFQRILIVLAVFLTSVIVIYFTVIIPGEMFSAYIRCVLNLYAKLYKDFIYCLQFEV